MKQVKLINKEEAKKIFKRNIRSNINEHYLKIISDENVEINLLDIDVLPNKFNAVDLKIKLGFINSISLNDWDNVIDLELKDIKDLGAVLLINGKPYFLHVYKEANNIIIEKIGYEYPELKIIDFGSEGNNSIKNINCIIPCKDLEFLNISWCSSLCDISALPKFFNLKKLIMIGFKYSTQFQFIAQCFQLEILHQGQCDLVNLQHIQNLHNLTYLNVSHNESLLDLNPLYNLKKLNKLYLEECSNISDIYVISEFQDLKSLSITHNSKISDFKPLQDLTKLEDLELVNCDKLVDLGPISDLSNMKKLRLRRCENLSELSPLSFFFNLKVLELVNNQGITNLSAISKLCNLFEFKLVLCRNISDISPLSSLTSLNILQINRCSGIFDFSPISSLVKLKKLDVSDLEQLSNLKLLSNLTELEYFDATGCNNLVSVSHISNLPVLNEINLSECPNVRDIEKLSSLLQLKELKWIDSVNCSLILMQSALNRNDSGFVAQNADKWINEIILSKDAITFITKLISCLGSLQNNDRSNIFINVCNAMRLRGLQSEGLNDLDAFTWESWCNLVLDLDVHDAMDCFRNAVVDLNIQRETEVLLGPVIIAASELIDKHPAEKRNIVIWVNELLTLLNVYPLEQRQIAPSAAVFFASLNMKEEVLFWLQKATDEKAPLWKEKVLVALISCYARKGNFAECRRLLDQMQIQDEIDRSIAEMAQSMAQYYPIDAAFMLDEIQDLAISTETARMLLQQPKVLQEPQGVYQLLLHLQSNPDELATTLEILIEKDKKGKVAEAVKHLFLQEQPTGPSAVTLLQLCNHPAILDFVKPRALEKYKTKLQERISHELTESVPHFISEMQREEMIDQKEAAELIKLIQQ